MDGLGQYSLWPNADKNIHKNARKQTDHNKIQSAFSSFLPWKLRKPDFQRREIQIVNPKTAKHLGGSFWLDKTIRLFQQIAKLDSVYSLRKSKWPNLLRKPEDKLMD